MEGRQLAASAAWQGLLRDFPAISLEAIRDAAFTDRVDTKFVLREEALLPVLERLTGDYAALDVDGRRFTTYRTQYFDFPDFALFRRHHTGAGRRYKVRTRVYENTQMAFIEIKTRSPRGRTRKLRQRTAGFEAMLSEESVAFLAANGVVSPERLGPTLQNRFDRICLVNRERQERLTIDLDFGIARASGTLMLPGVAIAEFKQEKGGHAIRNAVFLQLMREAHARPTAFSKYCMGLLLTQPQIKHNLFKPQLRKLKRLMGEVNAGS